MPVNLKQVLALPFLFLCEKLLLLKKEALSLDLRKLLRLLVKNPLLFVQDPRLRVKAGRSLAYIVVILCCAQARDEKRKNKESTHFSSGYVQDEGKSTLTPMVLLNDELHQFGRLRGLVHTFARKYQVNPHLIGGIIYVESGGNPNAIRFEPKVYEKIKGLEQLSGFAPKLPSKETERVLRASGLGLMQVMGETARAKGFRGEYLTDLLEPELNLEIGVSLFAELLHKHEDPKIALFKYNAGANAAYPGPKANDYPSRVLAAIEAGHHVGFA